MTFTFSEAVSGFALSDASVSGGALSNLVHVGVNGSSQDIYTATFTPGIANAEAGSVQVNALSYTDVAGNNGAASNTVSFAGDTLAPTVSVAADHSVLLAGQTAALTFTFSEAVANFAFSDVTTNGGALSNLVHVGLDGSNHDIYTATFTPDVTDTVAGAVEVNAGSYTDTAGNHGTVSNTVSFSGDTKAPTSSPTLALANDTGPSDGITGDPRIIYTKADSADMLLYKADGAPSFSTTAPNFTTDGPHTVLVAEVDAAGNIGPASSLSFTLDTTPASSTPPSDSNAPPGNGNVIAGSTVNPTFVFNDAGPPTLAPNYGGAAAYDAGETALLGDSFRFAFDHPVSATEAPTYSLAFTGLIPNGATIDDLTGNHADITNFAAHVSGLSVSDSFAPPQLPDFHLV